MGLSQRDEVDRAIVALERAGRLSVEDAGEVAAVRALADVVDALTVEGRFDSDVWREYRLALRALREARPDGGDDDELGRLIAALRGDAPVVDAADGSGDARRGGGAAR